MQDLDSVGGVVDLPGFDEAWHHSPALLVGDLLSEVLCNFALADRRAETAAVVRCVARAIWLPAGSYFYNNNGCV